VTDSCYFKQLPLNCVKKQIVYHIRLQCNRTRISFSWYEVRGNNNKRRSSSTGPYVKVPRNDMATPIRLRATHCRGDT